MDALTPFIRAETQHVSTASKSSAPARRRRKAVVAGSVGAGVVVLLGGAYGVGYAVAGQYLPPNTTIEGVAVGGEWAYRAVKRAAELVQAGEADLAMTLRVRLRVMRLAGVRFGHAIPGSPASAKRGL